MSASPYQCHCWNNLGGELVYAKFKSYEGTTAFDEIDIFIDDDHHLNLPAASANTVKVEVYDPTDNGGGWYVLGCYQVNNEDRVKVDSINSTSGPPPPPGQVYVNNQIVTGITCPEPNPGERPADPPPRQRR